MRESKWLWRVEWPQPDTNFRPLPKRLEMEASLELGTELEAAEPLSPVEEKTRQILASEIGINQSLLESHIDKGPRSHIIGAFRILQKRLAIIKSTEYPCMYQTCICWQCQVGSMTLQNKTEVFEDSQL